ncbi:MAG: HAD-IC family P-type ATPase [bacterium]|nr:HAD-IC family P-type ATPase [bacterium]
MENKNKKTNSVIPSAGKTDPIIAKEISYILSSSYVKYSAYNNTTYAQNRVQMASFWCILESIFLLGMKAYYKQTVEEILVSQKTDPHAGLLRDEFVKRFDAYGPNKLEKEKAFRFFKILIDQIKSPLVFILIIAGIITIFLQEYTDTLVIFIAVTINTVIGVYQEGRASRAFEKLRSSVKKYAVVVRDGKQKEVETEQLVPGDLIILEAGAQVPADIRLIEVKGLEINEAILTGEWMPQEKTNKAIAENVRITEQKNMAWMGTLVEDGYAKGIVVATGKHTELGKIAGSLKQEEEITPFQKSVSRLARLIGIIIVFIVIVIFTLGVFEGQGVPDMFLTAVAIAVAAIPEGLPVAVTVILAISMSRILGKGGLVKKLIKAETLGSTTVILTDKTGTLTKGEMELKHALSCDMIFAEKHAGKDPAVIRIGVFTSGAFIENEEKDPSQWIIRGKPTDKALLRAGVKMNITPKSLFGGHERIDYLPFDSERRIAVSLNGSDVGNILHITGAPELLIYSASYAGDVSRTLSESDKLLIQEAYDTATQQGMRVVAVGYKAFSTDEIPRKNIKELLANIIFTGLIIFHDPIREDVPAAITSAKEAGLRPILVTGDHANTARAVAHETGLSLQKEVITGEMIETASDEELKQILKINHIFARILPSQKLRLVKILRSENEVVAMTGDGVNDSPALTEADIGIAVGSGTDVAKEASDLILLHDSFNIIVKAIEEGRVVLANLRKIVTYILATNFSEVILISAALLLRLPLPVLPVQILWANLIEEGFMNFAFAFEKGEDVLKEDIHARESRKIITQEMAVVIFGIGIITSLLLVGVMLFLLSKNYPIEHIRTILFAGLSLDAIFFVFSLKSFKKPIWKTNIFSNKYLVGAFFISFVGLVSAVTLPPLQHILQTVTPTATEFIILIGIGLFNLFAIEGVKWYYIRKFSTIPQ